MTPGAKFRALVAARPIQCIGVSDAMTARLAERCGAPAVYVSGFVAAAIVTGMPDLGIINQSEMFEHIRRICRATALPVIADADTGYGGILAVRRTVQLWEEAGAAGLHIEDQVMPKRCGHIAGKAIIPVAEMVQKLHVAQDARRDPDFFLIARSDAVAVTGLDDALARCQAYAEAGADALFVDAPESIQHMRQIAEILRPLGKPLLFNAAPTGKSPALSRAQLQELGFGIVIYPIEAMLAAHRAATLAMRAILDDGQVDRVADQLTGFHEFNRFIGLPNMIEDEQRYAA